MNNNPHPIINDFVHSDLEASLTLAEFSFECTSIAAYWIRDDGSLYRVNQAACLLLGYSREELEGMSIFDIDLNVSHATWPKNWIKLQNQKTLSFTAQHRTKNNTFFPVYVTINHLQVGSHEFNLAFVQDLRNQVQIEAALRETQERYALVIQATNDGIWDWDLKTNQVYFSDRWHSMLGLNPAEPCHTLQDWLDRVHGEDLKKVQNKLSHYRYGQIEQLEMECRIRHQNGHYLWVLCRGMSLNDSAKKICRIAGSMTDITERREAQNQLLYEALHDPLTGLPNRALLLDRLKEIILLSYRSSKLKFAVLFLDLDRFKVINDSLGHHAGDQLLMEIARRLTQCVRGKDTVARLGGDEFIVVLQHLTGEEEAIETAQRILACLNRPIHLQEQIIYPGVSIGIALSDRNCLSSEDYLRRADIAMYQTKASKHSRYSLFTQEMEASVNQRLQLEVDLQSAIERQEFELQYQPIVSLKTHRVLGFEALIRWHHPSRGLLSPDHFISIAEETGLILPIGSWVIQEVCHQIQQWKALNQFNASLFVTINLSSHQIIQHDFVKQIHQILAETQVSACNIKLEITESTIIENTEIARDQLLALKASQIQICMDDFGTGYSSLGYLHQLPIDCLKIDQSFVQEIETQKDSHEIIRAILAIADSLNMDVIAEGIETDLQVNILREIGCIQGQGFYFHPPVSQKNATEILQSLSPVAIRRPASTL